MANEQNLKPIKKGQLSNEELKKRQSNGGKKSVKVRREKKLLSQIYADMLCKKLKVEIDGKKRTMSGHMLIETVAASVLSRADSASVAMIKEIREATEGTKAKLDMSGEIILYGDEDEDENQSEEPQEKA